MPSGRKDIAKDGEKHQWGKGQSGNPKGRPKKIPELEKLLNEVLGDIDDKTSQFYKIIEALTKKALKGDVRAAEVILNRAYGQPKQAIDLKSEDGITFNLGDNFKKSN